MPVKKKIVTQYFDDGKYNLLKNGIALRKRCEKNITLLELKINRGQGKSLEWVSDITKNNRPGFVQYNFQNQLLLQVCVAKKILLEHVHGYHQPFHLQRIQ